MPSKNVINKKKHAHQKHVAAVKKHNKKAHEAQEKHLSSIPSDHKESLSKVHVALDHKAHKKSLSKVHKDVLGKDHKVARNTALKTHKDVASKVHIELNKTLAAKESHKRVLSKKHGEIVKNATEEKSSKRILAARDLDRAVAKKNVKETGKVVSSSKKADVKSQMTQVRYGKERLASKLNMAHGKAGYQQKAVLRDVVEATLALTDEQRKTRITKIKKIDTELHVLHRNTLKADLPAYRVVKQYIRNLKIVNDKTLKTKAIHLLIANLKSLSHNFMDGEITLSKFHTGSLDVIDRYKKTIPHTREARTILEKISEVVRTLFNYLDKAITWAIDAEQTMEERATPFARLLTGRDHFFNKPRTSLSKTLMAFEEALLALEVAVSQDEPEKNPKLISN